MSTLGQKRVDPSGNKILSSNDAAIKKREQRAKAKTADPVAFKEKANSAQQDLRRRVRLKKFEASLAVQDNGSTPTSPSSPKISQSVARKQTIIRQDHMMDDLMSSIKVMISDHIKKPDRFTTPQILQSVQNIVSQFTTVLDLTQSNDAIATQLVEAASHEVKPKFRIKKPTALRYISDLVKIRSMFTGEPRGNHLNIDFLQDKDNLVEFIDKSAKSLSGATKGQLWSLNTKRSAYGSITAFLRRSSEHQNLYDFYKEVHIFFIKKIEEIRNKNQLSEKEKVQYLPWDTILKIWTTDRFPKDTTKRYLYRAVAAFYTLQKEGFVRRVQDSCYLKLVTQEQVSNGSLDDRDNYIVVNKQREPVQEIFNIYKTSPNYKKQIFPIEGRLAKILEEYIKFNNIKPGDVFFANESGNFYSPGAWSRTIGDIFQSVNHQSKRTSVNILRHSRISKYLSKSHSVEEKIEFARKFAHQIFTQSLYMRKEIHGDDDDDDLQAIDVFERDSEDGETDIDDGSTAPKSPPKKAIPSQGSGWRSGRTPAQIEQERAKNRLRMAASRKPATVVAGSRRSTRRR